MHPLHELFVNPSLQDALSIDPHRVTGRSTALAFGYLSKAIKQPRTRIYTQDHHGTTMADRHLLQMIKNIVGALDLKCFTFGESITGCYISFGEPGGNGKRVK